MYKQSSSADFWEFRHFLLRNCTGQIHVGTEQGWCIEPLSVSMNLSSIFDHKQAFQTYLEKTTEKNIFVQRFSEMFCLDCNQPASLLDLGSHNGALTIRYLGCINSKLPEKSIVTCVDPSHEAMEVFQSQKLPDYLQFVFVEATAEDFFSQSSETFDWIVASHCFYWSPSLDSVLAQVCSRGRKSVVVLRGKRGIYQVQSKYKHLVGNPKDQLYTADDVENTLVRLKATFNREDIVSTISIPKPGDPMLSVMIGFFLQTRPEHISPEIESEVYSFIASLGSEMRHDVSFFWIEKN